MTNAQLFEDLKQFIAATVTQQTSDVREDIAQVKDDLAGVKGDVATIKDDILAVIRNQLPTARLEVER